MDDLLSGLSDRHLDRRAFLRWLGLGGAALAAGAGGTTGDSPARAQGPAELSGADAGSIYSDIMKIAGARGFPLSFVEGDYADAESYVRAARAKVLELFHYEPPPTPPRAEIVDRWEHDDHVQERVVFSTSPWFRVPAYVLIPKGFSGRRPGIVDLHCHGAMYLFGKEKVMPTPGGDHPAMAAFRERVYDGRSTSLELCRRGYVVIAIDAFYFGERRTMFDDDVAKYGWDRDKYSIDDVDQLNRKSGQGQATLSRSLWWAGTTWQGIVHLDDMRTVDYLVSRPEVDPDRIGCLGISFGGDRTDYLAGLDSRIKCAASVGWMSALKPMIKAHVNTHSFVHFLPGLAHFLDLPDLPGCMVPKPLMVQQCSRDALYPLEGMQQAVDKIAAIYRKAGAADKFQGRFYDITHRYSKQMQSDTFNWLDQWLKP